MSEEQLVKKIKLLKKIQPSDLEMEKAIKKIYPKIDAIEKQLDTRLDFYNK